MADAITVIANVITAKRICGSIRNTKLEQPQSVEFSKANCLASPS